MGNAIIKAAIGILFIVNPVKADDTTASRLFPGFENEPGYLTENGQERQFLSVVGFEDAQHCPSFAVHFFSRGKGIADMNLYGAGPLKVYRPPLPEVDEPALKPFRHMVWSEDQYTLERKGPVCVIDLTYSYRLIDKETFGEDLLSDPTE